MMFSESSNRTQSEAQLNEFQPADQYLWLPRLMKVRICDLLQFCDFCDYTASLAELCMITIIQLVIGDPV